MFNTLNVDIKKFAQFLRKKNSLGNMRSIHLNALPDRQYTKLGLDSLKFVQEKLPQEFIGKLFNNGTFTVEIKVKDLTPLMDIVKKLEKEREIVTKNNDFENIRKIDSKIKVAIDEVKKFKQVLKSLNTLYSRAREEEQELGVKTFGFGYPMIIKRSNTNPKKIIKAPLMIWYLDIEQSSSEARTWKIRKTQDHPVIVNNVLISHIENDLGINVDKVNEIPSEEELVSLANVKEVLKEVIKNINPGMTNLFEKELSLNELDKFPDHKSLEEECINRNGLMWLNNGVFGCYRISKESILADLKKIEILENIDDNEWENEDKLSPLCPIETDPSQQSIIDSLQQQNKILIQGPPGTGKSQALTAIIANALSNKKKCLIVCEKKTALDVISENLEKQGLGNLVATITNPMSDRTLIVRDVRDLSEIQHNYSILPEVNFGRNEQKILSLIDKINKQHQSITSVDFGSQTWTTLVGDFLNTKKYIENNPLVEKVNRNGYDFDIEEYRDIEEKIDNIFKYFLRVKDIKTLCDINRNRFLKLHVLESQREIEKEISQNKTLIQELIQEIQSFTKLYQEKNDKYFRDGYSRINEDLNEIREDLFSTIDAYNSNLEKTYSETLNQLILKIDKIKNLLFQKSELYGEKFSNNTAINNSLTTALAFFSSEFRSIKDSKKEMISSIEELENYVNSNRLVDFKFLEGWDLNKVKNLKELEDSIGKFTKYLHQFDEKRQSEINKYNENISLGKYKEHPCIDFSGRIGKIKIKCSKVSNFIKDNSILEISDLHCDKTLKESLVETQRLLDETNSSISAVESKRKSIIDAVSLIDSSLNLHVNIDKEYKDIIGKESKLRERIESLLNQSNLSSQLSFIDLKYRLIEMENFFTDTQNEIKENWKEFFDFIKELENSNKKIKNIAEELYYRKIQEPWKGYFTNWYFEILLERIYTDSNLPDSKTENILDDLRAAIRGNQEQQKNQIRTIWAKEQNLMKQRFESNQYNTRNIKSLYNLKGSNGQRRNSLRKIIERDFDLFTSFKPVVLTNPITCSAIFPLKDGLFDIVIFDEASQLRIEDTFPALYRGKTKIVSGDKHQMPPSSYFGSSYNFVIDESIEEKEEETDDQEDLQALADDYRDDLLNLVDSESLLDFAETMNFTQTHLDTHYRSRHPDLIEFSNAAFYGSNLIPLPPKTNETPIQFHRVDGLYEGNENVNEIEYIFNLLKKIERDPDGKYPSIGIATFNQKQQARFYEEIFNSEDEEFKRRIEEMKQQRDQLFIKNLENIQGEERDIIIISTTFGRDKDKRFLQNFGPVNKQNGYRLLNVLITRAKKKIFICTSIPEEYISTYSTEINQHGNTGRGIFYAYLAYAKAVSDNDNELKTQILETLRQKCYQRKHISDMELTNQTESVFEEEVISRLEDHIDKNRIIPQFSAGGFRIDFVVKDLSGKPRLAIECDGAKYHSSPEAYCWDLCRQQQLEEHDFIFHRIWSTDWFTNEEKELKGLLAFISDNENPNVVRDKSLSDRVIYADGANYSNIPPSLFA